MKVNYLNNTNIENSIIANFVPVVVIPKKRNRFTYLIDLTHDDVNGPDGFWSWFKMVESFFSRREA